MSVSEPHPRPLLLCVDGSAASRAAASRGAELLAAPSAIAGEILHGKAAEQLADAGAGLDLLVCGSRGYGPARAILLGSVSHALAHRFRCPLLVLPHEAGDTLATLVAPAAEATAG
jgi:nucleotide-binding universal stress UspA family protein